MKWLASSSRVSNALELIGEHAESDRLTLPTGACVFRRGEPVQAIHIVEQGLVELISGPRNRIRYGPGQLFFYEDLVASNQFHSRDAKALTPPGSDPVEPFRLPRLDPSPSHPCAGADRSATHPIATTAG